MENTEKYISITIEIKFDIIKKNTGNVLVEYVCLFSFGEIIFHSFIALFCKWMSEFINFTPTT